MPFSDSNMLSPVVGLIEELQPRSILDVGIGFGQYGFLCRTNLEHVNLFEWDDHGARKREKTEWEIQIDGVEAFPAYVTPVQEYAYNNILIGDALEVLPKMTQSYDLVMAIEILEHFDKDDGIRFLDMLQRRSHGTVLVTTPKDFIHQDYPANPYENHRSLWSREDLEARGFKRFLDNPNNWIACYQK
ncbi:MAG: hypothetical protein RL120_00370 [Gammaproteobacteria bacterium]